MKSTAFVIIMVAKYFMDSLPMYKIYVAQLEREREQYLLPTKKRLIMAHVVFIFETILFVAACFIFLLKCLGVIPWW